MSKDVCGLQYTQDGMSYCFLSSAQTETACVLSCPNFIQQLLDGDEPFTPAQHLMMDKDSKARRGMKNIRGIKF